MKRDDLYDRDWQHACQRLRDLDPGGEKLLDFAYEITGNERHVCNEHCQHELEELLAETEDRANDIACRLHGLMIKCNWCKKPIEKPGGLLFSPPDKDGNCKKLHACAECYEGLAPKEH